MREVWKEWTKGNGKAGRERNIWSTREKRRLEGMVGEMGACRRRVAIFGEAEIRMASVTENGWRRVRT